MQLNFIYDDSVVNAPAGFFQGLATAAAIIDATILDPITVAINIGFGEDNGQALGSNTLGEAQPSFGALLTYPQLEVYLNNAAETNGAPPGALGLAADDPSNGAGFFVSAAQLIAWGILPGPPTQVDGYAGFSSTLPFTYDPTNGVVAGTYDFVSVALHELTHALGRYVTSTWFTPMTLLGYAPDGTLDLNNADPRYLSIDGGVTSLGSLDTTSDPADLASNGPPDPFGAALPSGATLAWTPTDTKVMAGLGFITTIPAAPQPPAFTVLDTTTGQNSTTNGAGYTGSVAGISHGFVAATADGMTISATVGGAFIQGGTGNDTIIAANVAGANILEGGTGSNRLVGSLKATDSFIVDERGATADTWNTIVNMHKGDTVSVLGLTQADFALHWINGPGAAGAGVLTLKVTQIGGPTDTVVLKGYTMADLNNGRLQVAFGTSSGTNTLNIDVLR